MNDELKELIENATSDGKVTKKELNFIYDKAKELGVDKTEVDIYLKAGKIKSTATGSNYWNVNTVIAWLMLSVSWLLGSFCDLFEWGPGIGMLIIITTFIHQLVVRNWWMSFIVFLDFVFFVYILRDVC